MNKNEYRDMWVYIEHEGGKVLPVSLELCCEARKLCDAAVQQAYVRLRIRPHNRILEERYAHLGFMISWFFSRSR